MSGPYQRLMEKEGIKNIRLFGLPTLIFLIILLHIGFPWDSGPELSLMNIVRVYVFALFIGIGGCLLYFGLDSYLTRFEVKGDKEVVRVTPLGFFSTVGLLGILGSIVICIGCGVIILFY